LNLYIFWLRRAIHLPPAYRQGRSLLATRIKYRKNNPEKIRESRKKSNTIWRKNNPEKKKAINKEYYNKNAEKIKTRVIIWRKNNPEKNMQTHIKRRAKKKEVVHAFKISEWIQKKNNTNGICPKCNLFVGLRKITLDHIYPLSKASKGRVYTIDDVQPLCFSCNSIKNNKIEVSSNEN
jgi:5-methylcytosine-specific restriction endonuclease McrA